MNFPEANEEADRLNRFSSLKAEVVRILPEDIDPITDGDNGWDVEVTVLHPTGYGTTRLSEGIEQ
jgi:hypothetical protein